MCFFLVIFKRICGSNYYSCHKAGRSQKDNTLLNIESRQNCLICKCWTSILYFDIEELKMSSSYLLYIGFVAAAAVELYFFLMQRIPLSVSREHGIDSKTCRFMLPSWYSTVWIFKIGKWVLIALIWLSFGWLPAILCAVVSFVLSAVLPIPFTHFANMMEKRLESELVGPNTEVARSLVEALRDSRSTHGF